MSKPRSVLARGSSVETKAIETFGLDACATNLGRRRRGSRRCAIRMSSAAAGNSQIVFDSRQARIRRSQENCPGALARPSPPLRRRAHRSSCLTTWDGRLAITRSGRAMLRIYWSVLAPLPSPLVAPPSGRRAHRPGRWRSRGLRVVDVFRRLTRLLIETLVAVFRLATHGDTTRPLSDTRRARVRRRHDIRMCGARGAFPADITS